jgi:hypothetical protein
MMIAIVFEPRLRAIYAFFPTLTDGDWPPIGVTHMTTSGQSRTKMATPRSRPLFKAERT